MPERKLTFEQELLVGEFITTYGLSPEQISFDGEKAEPIFDFDALCLLREKLTDFKAVDVSEVGFHEIEKEACAVCVVVKQNGDLVTVSDFAQLEEVMPDGTRLVNSMQAKRVARARAMRTVIRAAGVNLLKAHRQFLETGQVLDFQPVDPRQNKIKEVHALAGTLGLISGADKREYHRYLAELFDGRTSCKDLDDNELQRLIISLRAMNRLNKFRNQSQEKLAAL